MKKTGLLWVFLIAFLFCAKSQTGCNPPAQISGWKNFLMPNDVLFLTGPAGSMGYQWIVDGVVSGANPSFSFQPTQKGSYQIQLIVNNGNCQDTSAIWTLTVGGCGEYDENQKMYWEMEDSLMLDFHTAPVSCYVAGKLTGQSWVGGSGSFIESSVTMSDDAGNLLFYTNGTTIWNKNHQVMPNGRGILGHYSTRQGSLAFPDPADPEVYYLFTLDALENQNLNGLRYSKIDMRLAGGLGDVVPFQKNILVTVTNMENMDAVYHANGKDVWLLAGVRTIMQPGNQFNIKSFLITDQGVQGPLNTTPVPTEPYLIKFSHDGRWMTAGLTLNEFDNQNGQFQFFADMTPLQNLLTLGMEFSSNNQLLYLSDIFGRIVQLDLSVPVPSHVLNSATVINTGGLVGNFFGYRMELGPDGRIYIVNSSSSFLAYISFPNVPGIGCNFTLQGVMYPNNFYFRSQNLPTYITGRYTNDRLKIKVSKSTPCLGEEIRVWPHCTIGTYGFSYSILGDTTHVQHGDTLYFSPQQAGPIDIIGILENACGKYYDTLTIDVKPLPTVELGPARGLCRDSMILDMGHLQGSHLLWFDGSIEPKVVIRQTGSYWLQLTDSIWGCINSDTIEIRDKPLLYMPDLGPDTALCAGGSLWLSAQKGEGSIRWNDGSTAERLLLSAAGLYWVEVEDSCGRVFRDSVEISMLPPVKLGITDSLFFCKGESTRIDASTAGYAGYQWADGPQGAMRNFQAAGRFILEAKDALGCIGRDTVEVLHYPDTPPLALQAQDSLCTGESLQVDATTEGIAFYLWADGPEGAERLFEEEGIFQLHTMDENGCEKQGEIRILQYDAIQLSLPGELIYCREKASPLDARSDSFRSYSWMDGWDEGIRWVDSAGVYSLEVTDIHGCTSSASTQARMSNCSPLVFMPSAFSPNSDGINDFFGPSFRPEIIRYELTIYNRWGERVYQSENPFPGWDGTFKGQSCPEGVYVYTLSYFTDVNTVSHLQGTMTLIR